MSKNLVRNRLGKRYDQMWSTTIGLIRKGELEIDPVLNARAPDIRRGLTLIARPSANVRQRVGAFLDELRAIEPDQHYYAPSELHLTVLSLFTATVNHEPFFARAEQYVSALDAALQEVAPIRIEFIGITASQGAVMIQGFCEDDTLNNLRDALRARLRILGLNRAVDTRYRLETAHMTVLRFRSPLREGNRFANILELERQRSFGIVNFRNLTLVKNDWYMTHGVLETVKNYPVKGRRQKSD